MITCGIWTEAEEYFLDHTCQNSTEQASFLVAGNSSRLYSTETDQDTLNSVYGVSPGLAGLFPATCETHAVYCPNLAACETHKDLASPASPAFQTT